MQSAALQIYDIDHGHGHGYQDHQSNQFIPSTSNDERVVAMWLHGKSPKTRKEYVRDLASFSSHTGGQPLRTITLDRVQGFVTALVDKGYKPRTVARRLAAIKSLLSFGAKIGYLRFNVGAPVKGPKAPNDLSRRILSEEEVISMIRLEPSLRNRSLLRLLYVSGARAAEIHGLVWGDIVPNPDGNAVVRLHGKGDKTRHVVIPSGTWGALSKLRGDAGDDDPVFLSRKRNALSTVQIWRIVRAAAERAGIQKGVSPHWLRHACASHSIQRGCNVAIVQQTLGHSSLQVTSCYVHVKPSDSAGLYLAVN